MFKKREEKKKKKKEGKKGREKKFCDTTSAQFANVEYAV